jgi:hypothetical protein
VVATARAHPAVASVLIGLVLFVAIVILGPGGDLMVPTIGAFLATGLAVTTYLMLRGDSRLS